MAKMTDLERLTIITEKLSEVIEIADEPHYAEGVMCDRVFPVVPWWNLMQDFADRATTLLKRAESQRQSEIEAEEARQANQIDDDLGATDQRSDGGSAWDYPKK